MREYSMESPNSRRGFRRLLDLSEQWFVLGLYGWLVMRLIPESATPEDALAITLLLLSEGLVCVLLVIRRPTTDISLNARDWLLAAAGTFLPLLVVHGGEPAFGLFGAYLILAGLLTHVGAKLSLLRSFGLVAANRGVKVGGLYSVIRHPMYAGYMLSHIGFLLASPSIWNLAVYVAAWSLLIGRIYAEEQVLNGDPAYSEYASSVRYRIIPGVY